MLVTVVVLMCHALPGIPQDVCREEIVARTDAMQACLLFPTAIADWKAHSIFAGEAWRIARIKCVPGEYQVKDAI